MHTIDRNKQSDRIYKICEGSEKPIDKLLQNLEDQATLLPYKKAPDRASPFLNPSQTGLPARLFYNWSAGGAWCPYMARLLFTTPINSQLLNRGSI